MRPNCRHLMPADDLAQAGSCVPCSAGCSDEVAQKMVSEFWVVCLGWKGNVAGRRYGGYCYLVPVMMPATVVLEWVL